MIATPLRLYLVMLAAVINLTLAFFVLTLPALPLIAFLDVGQGDSILIQDSDLTQILIDAGPGAKAITEIKKIVPFFDKTIELVIITHPEKDHFGGLITLLKHFKIKQVFLTGAVKKTPEFKTLISELKKADVPLGLLYKDVNISTRNINLRVLWPLTQLLGISLERANNSSAVTLIESGRGKLLLLGDVEKVVEEQLSISHKNILAGAILKLGHHGSKTSTSVALLDAIRPKAAIISVGKNNPYKHPSPEITNLLKQYGIPFWRTDLLGTIKFALPQLKML